jgi:hypothetical protein
MAPSSTSSTPRRNRTGSPANTGSRAMLNHECAEWQPKSRLDLIHHITLTSPQPRPASIEVALFASGVAPISDRCVYSGSLTQSHAKIPCIFSHAVVSRRRERRRFVVYVSVVSLIRMPRNYSLLPSSLLVLAQRHLQSKARQPTPGEQGLRTGFDTNTFNSDTKKARYSCL